MGKKSFSKIYFLLLATLFMWIKTYIVYKTSFDIKIENFTQEVILFINPISFLLFIFGIGLFMKEKNRNRYIFGASIFVTILLLANMVFYRFYNDFLTIPVLFQTSNMGDLGSSIGSLFLPSDLLMLVDLAILYWLLKKPTFKSSSRLTRKISLFLISCSNLFL
jgi:lipoteichoic acid synthase